MSEYEKVPKTLKENLQARESLMRLAAKDRQRQEAIRYICREEPLYWLNMFGWVYEPRPPRGPVDLPFLTWPCQDVAFNKVNACIEGAQDLVAVKSRDMGYSWIVLACLLHRWQFIPLQSIAVCSRVDELVEQTGSSDSLFWKLDMLLERQPAWLLPKGFDWRVHRLRKRLLNPELRCDIKGYATTSDVSRGGRKTVTFADEFAAFEHTQGMEAIKAMQGASNTVIMVSTPKGANGAFYDQYKRSLAGGYHRKVQSHRLHWTEHPEKRKGLYTTRGGEIKILDEAYQFPADYPFVTDREGKPRSPAYDAENERKSDQFMAEEWDMDFAGAGSAFFAPEFLERLEADFCRPASRRGRLIYDSESLEPRIWLDDPKGPIQLWVNLIQGKPPPGEYGNGCDISTGTGATPSTQAVGDLATGEKAAEYADARRDPTQFARDAIALSKWFGSAKLIWETNGVGGIFTKTVLNSGYRSIYFKRTNETGLLPKSTDNPGWHSSPQSKRELFEDFRDGLGRDYVERSRDTILDAAGYTYSLSGGVEHSQERTTDDASAAGVNHGDRAVASALLCKLVREHKKNRPKLTGQAEPKQKARPGSVAWIIEQEERERQERDLFGGLNL